MCDLRALGRNASCARGWDMSMRQVGTHVRSLGFVLKAAWKTEGYKVEDDMVENSVRILWNICPHHRFCSTESRIMKPFLYLELELNDLSLSFI